jgi:hypothetical protein
MAQDFSSVARRQIAGILCVFQDLATKLQAKKTSQIVQVISEQFLSKKFINEQADSVIRNTRHAFFPAAADALFSSTPAVCPHFMLRREARPRRPG